MDRAGLVSQQEPHDPYEPVTAPEPLTAGSLVFHNLHFHSQ